MRMQQVPTPEGLTAFDLDNIRLTAQFVARNGKAFLTGLAAKEHGNPAFNFLKPTHSLFGFFTALCDAYSKVLMPPKGLMDKLRRNSTDRCPLPCATHTTISKSACVTFMYRYIRKEIDQIEGMAHQAG